MLMVGSSLACLPLDFLRMFDHHTFVSVSLSVNWGEKHVPHGLVQRLNELFGLPGLEQHLPQSRCCLRVGYYYYYYRTIHS